MLQWFSSDITRLSQVLQKGFPPHLPPAHPCRRETLSVPCVWEELQKQFCIEAPTAHPHRRDSFSVRSVQRALNADLNSTPTSTSTEPRGCRSTPRLWEPSKAVPALLATGTATEGTDPAEPQTCEELQPKPQPGYDLWLCVLNLTNPLSRGRALQPKSFFFSAALLSPLWMRILHVALCQLQSRC